MTGYAESYSYVTEEFYNPQVVKKAKAYKLPDGRLRLKNGKRRYITSEGKVLRRKWIWYRNAVYYLDDTGETKTGAFAYKGQSYYFDKYGRLYISKTRTVENRTYYYGSTGAMLRSNWRIRNCEQYYHMSNGVMATNRWIEDKYVGKDGKYIAGYGENTIHTNTFKPKWKSRRLIIVGASRVCDMAQAVTTDSNTLYIASRGMDYEWFSSVALPRLKRYLKKYPASKVVIQMGNNDLKDLQSGRFGKYAAQYRKLIGNYPKAHFYFMDILPSRPLSKAVNADRQKFNQKLKETFPRNWIGGYDYMIYHAFETGDDNEHYSPNESRKIYNYILSKTGMN